MAIFIVAIVLTCAGCAPRTSSSDPAVDHAAPEQSAPPSTADESRPHRADARDDAIAGAQQYLDEHGHPAPPEQFPVLVQQRQIIANRIAAHLRNHDVRGLRQIADDPDIDDVMRSSAALAVLSLDESQRALFLTSFPRNARFEYALALVDNHVFERACGDSGYPCGNRYDEGLIRLAEAGDTEAIAISIEHQMHAFAAEEHDWIFGRTGPAWRIPLAQPTLFLEECAKRVPGTGDIAYAVFFDDRCGGPTAEALAEAKRLDALVLSKGAAALRDRITSQMRNYVGTDGCTESR